MKFRIKKSTNIKDIGCSFSIFFVSHMC